jgi:adenosylcobinamide-GDP ribazoletransferase
VTGAGQPPPQPQSRPWPARVAVSMFTILPVPVSGPVDAELATRAVLWLPAVGLLLSVPAGLALLAAGGTGADPLRRLLGAVLAVALLGLLTGGLHLDGLADTADGLASRRPAEQALEIMRRGDTGPLGVAALIFTVALQVTALAAAGGRLALTALVLGAVTARTAVLLATGPAFPAARPGGFGALVAGRTSARACAAAVAAQVALVAGFGLLAGGTGLAARLLTATAAGLLTGTGVARTARRQLGGLTGDVFGAVAELAMAVTLTVVVIAG